MTPTLPDRRGLRDAALSAGWRAVVLSMIFALSLAACALAYRTLFALLAAAWLDAACTLAAALLAGAGVAWLAAHRGDLVEM